MRYNQTAIWHLFGREPENKSKKIERITNAFMIFPD